MWNWRRLARLWIALVELLVLAVPLGRVIGILRDYPVLIAAVVTLPTAAPR
jgi:hypothetical protein